ncbi:dnaJ homolog subfamily C member 12 [Molossus molossus]|uniref:DnaJ homolog subfamily C member 12 n=1 Tax=Molossus molossus TaxID=27622 RepID=A0A7J8DPF7_MOLMO|nr:dnaJ homolog subfamily C member 12 [Molossus molossus]XP_036121441.1 dnaJ homolog subfamily C member 12 [Molossus molossus]XP_036121442.1 dnaJ homolog subfamily C member 12 [Molossus molossus]XP_036121443.1 dnaJ homolog subfamily C member 12 [Molossus molossus]KAF6424772.1 DnaJ heat shock protein family (Hsp40) member C12 [Molossus molossus]
MDEILKYRLEDNEDYYTLLGCDELSSVEQILAEFKVRALECHPDKHPENSKAVETFQKLQKAKEILTNEESRARYDHWRRSQMSMPFQQWEALNDSVKTSMHWAVRGKKDLMLEETEQTHTNKVENEEWKEPREIKKEELGSTTEEMEQQESESLEKSFSPQNPDSSSFSDVNSSHVRFRWSGDAPSELLRKFRNYEI